MRFRLGLVMGFGAGYVLGTKAGRERYEQIRELASNAMGSPKLEHMREQAEHALERAAIKLPESVQDRLPESMRAQRPLKPEMAAPQEPFATSRDGLT